MATVETCERKLSSVPERLVLYDVGWEGYQTLLKMVSNRRLRVTYDRGDVEIMSPLFTHERYKSLFASVVETITEELDMPCLSGGSTTFNRQDLDRGLEPDECFYLTNAGRLRDAEKVDLSVDPPPDLVIEVDITSSSLNRLEIYAALGVPEIWRFKDEALSVLLLQADGTYAPSPTSAAFPFLPMNEIVRFLLEYDWTDDTRWRRAFRAWVREVIVPKVRGGEG